MRVEDHAGPQPSPSASVASVAVIAATRAFTTVDPGWANAASTLSLSSTAYSRGSHRPPPRARADTHRDAGRQHGRLVEPHAVGGPPAGVGARA